MSESMNQGSKTVYHTETQELYFGSPDKRGLLIPEFKKHHYIWMTVVTACLWIKSKPMIHKSMNPLTQHVIIESWMKYKPNKIIEEDLQELMKIQEEKRNLPTNLPYDTEVFGGVQCHEFMTLNKEMVQDDTTIQFLTQDGETSLVISGSELNARTEKY